MPYLSKYKDYFKTYMSCSSPHLGVRSGDSKLVETGYNLLTMWKKFTSLKQLGLKDGSDAMDSFLFKLSQKEGLNWFKEIILVSSPQDTYSPYDSSRIQISMKNSSNLKMSKVYFGMVDSMMAKCKGLRLRRVDVCMKFADKSLDSMIGRAAHIALISDSMILEALATRYAQSM